MSHWGRFLSHCLGLGIRPNAVFYYEVLQLLSVMVDSPFEEMFAEELRGTSFLLYLQFLSSHDLGENAKSVPL